MPSLDEIDPVVLEKKIFKFRRCIFKALSIAEHAVGIYYLL